MAFIQCECGSKIDLSPTAMRVTCPGCGQRFTVPQVEDFAESDAMDEVAAATGVAGHAQPLSATMMHDLPVITQFENHYAQSIVAVGMFTSAAVMSEPAAVGMLADRSSPLGAAYGAGAQMLTPPSRLNGTPLGNVSTSKSHRNSKTKLTESTDAQLKPGQRLLDRYEVQRKIGQGGMSTVYEACDHVRGEQVALKVLLPHLAAKSKLQERFLQEGRVSSNFSHPNIARVYDLHQTDSLILLSMELLHGSTLRHDMHRRKTQGQSYRPAEVVAILRQVTDALAVVHAAEIVHRDLKPENLWLGLDGTVKVMDFGIARDSIKGAHTTGPRGSGTPYYIAPEQLSASPTLDHRADQYSLAIIAYELLTGELPQGAVTPPHLKQPHIPKKLSQAIFRGLSAAPQQRFADIRAFQHALEYDRRMPMIAKLAIGAVACALLGSTGYAFQRYGRPLFETKVSPVWAEVSGQNVIEGKSLTFTVRHPDCWLTGKSLKYKLLSDAPAGAQIDSQTGRFQWIPTEAQGPRDYSFNIMAIVEEEGRAPVVEERAFQVAVEEAFDAPLFDTPDAVNIKEHTSLELPIQATDPNQPKIGLHYELLDPPAGMSIDDRTGVVQWTPQEDAGGTNPSVAVRVSLAGNKHADIASVRKLNLHVAESIDKLSFTSADKLPAKVGEAIKFRVTARDPNTPTLNTYFRLKGGDRIGMTIEPQTGEIYWTPTEEHSAKTFELAVDACWDGTGKTEVVGTQPLKIVVAEYDPPKVEEPKVAQVATEPVVREPAPTLSQVGGNGAAPGNCPTNNGAGGGGIGQSGSQGGGGQGTCPNSGNGNGNGGNGNGGNSNNNGTCSGNGNGGNSPGLKNKGNLDDLLIGILNRQIPSGKQPQLGVRLDDLLQNQAANNKSNGQKLIEKLPIGKLPIDKLPTNQSANKQPPTGLPTNNLPFNNLPMNNSANSRVPTNKLPISKAPGRQPSRSQANNQPFVPRNGNTGINGNIGGGPKVSSGANGSSPRNQTTQGNRSSSQQVADAIKGKIMQGLKNGNQRR